MGQTKETIGRYQLVTRLAVGGMAEIFLAFERGLAGLERRIVIKRILPHLADQQNFLDMFLREARIIARMNHPNVVQIHELGHDDGQYFIAMEYLEGLTSRELILLSRDAGVPIPVEVCVEIILMACDGGLIKPGEKVIAVAGTAAGADTAVVVTSAPSTRLSDLHIHEIICKPL